MPTERPYLRLVKPTEVTESPQIDWRETPRSLSQLVHITSFLPNKTNESRLTLPELQTLATNLTTVLESTDESWVNSLDQFTDWETIFNRLGSAHLATRETDLDLSDNLHRLQTLALEAITKIGARNEMSPSANHNPAFVFLLRLLTTKPELASTIQPAFKDRHNLPANNRTGETSLLDWAEHQKNLDQIGQMLSNASSLPELLHLLSLIPLTRLTVHRTADYSANYSVVSFISHIIDEIEKFSINPNTPDSHLAKKHSELQRLCQPADGSQNGFFPPNLGEFKTREFIYQQLAQEFAATVDDLYTTQTPEPQSWVQLLWYSEDAIDPQQEFVFTKKDGNIKHIERISGEEVRHIINHAPLRGNEISLLPLTNEIDFIKPEDHFIVGLREKLESWFN